MTRFHQANCARQSRWAMFCFAALSVMLAVCLTPVRGQTVLTGQGAWSNTGNPLAGGQYNTRTLNDNSASVAAIVGFGTGNNTAGGLFMRGTANDDADANVDSFNLVIRSNQVFQTNQASIVSIPTHMFGNLNFPAGANGVSNVTWNVTVLNNLLAPTGLAINQMVNATQAGTGSLNVNQFNTASMNLAAGTYTHSENF